MRTAERTISRPEQTVESVLASDIDTTRKIAVSARNVGVAFGAGESPLVVLESINIDVREGEFLSIIGASGCGKTTLLRLFAGLLQPTKGEILFKGQRVTAPSRERAMIFQDYGRALLPWRTVWANVALAFERQHMPARDRRERSYALLQRMELADFGEYFPGQLSGGMQQRVQIARCLAQEPRLLLMDEPFGALDALTRQSLQDEIAKIALEQKTTVIFITHDLEEAIYLGDRVIALASKPGRIEATIEVSLPRPRNQLTTREVPQFLAHRHHLFGLLVGH